MCLQEDGKEFDSSRDREPLEFVVGSGKVVKGFETLVKGLEPGAKKTATVPADDAYGQWQEELTAKIPVARAPEVILSFDFYCPVAPRASDPPRCSPARWW